MNISILINTDSTGFKDDSNEYYETARILTALSKQISNNQQFPNILIDFDGNLCGTIKISKSEEKVK